MIVALIMVYVLQILVTFFIITANCYYYYYDYTWVWIVCSVFVFFVILFSIIGCFRRRRRLLLATQDVNTVVIDTAPMTTLRNPIINTNPTNNIYGNNYNPNMNYNTGYTQNYNPNMPGYYANQGYNPNMNQPVNRQY